MLNEHVCQTFISASGSLIISANTLRNISCKGETLHFNSFRSRDEKVVQFAISVMEPDFDEL